MSRPSNGAALSAAAAVSVAVVLAAIIRRSQQSARLRRHRRWVYRAGFQSLHREMDAAVRLAVTCGEAMLATPRASTSFKDSKNGKGGIDPQTATDVDNERLVMDTLKAEFPEVRVRLLMSGAFHRVCSVCSCARVRSARPARAVRVALAQVDLAALDGLALAVVPFVGQLERRDRRLLRMPLEERRLLHRGARHADRLLDGAAALLDVVVDTQHSGDNNSGPSLSLVFEFLPYQQILGRCSAVCRAWSQISTSKIEEWKLLETKAHAVRGLKGRSAGKLRGPTGLTVLPDGTLYSAWVQSHPFARSQHTPYLPRPSPGRARRQRQFS